jgi:hypothetical protein
MVVDSSGTRIAVTRPVLICPSGVDSLRESGETLTESVAGSKATTVQHERCWSRRAPRMHQEE